MIHVVLEIPGLWGLATYLISKSVAEYDPKVSMTEMQNVEITETTFKWPCLTLNFVDNKDKHMQEIPEGFKVYRKRGYGQFVL